MSNAKKILITGISGLIGQIAYQDLKNDFDITGLSRRELKGIKYFRNSITELKSIIPAFKDQDTVIHLAADPSDLSPWESILPNNIIGTYNVFEAARICGIKRIIFASSNHVTGMYENDHPYHHIVKGEYTNIDKKTISKISHLSEIRPDGYYGISKSYGEAMGRYYNETYNISVISLRIGSVIKWNHPLKNIRHFATWLSHRDQAQLIRKSILASTDTKFDIFYGVSNNDWRFWNIEHAKKIINFCPEDNAEEYRKN
tara:strand:+ start:957 stop:1730 length:774 start_codon:yes stop_codon:yes gene_type:complete